MEKGASDARGDDLFSIRGQLATWLNRLEPVPQPLLDPDDRANRGLQHDLCGFLLCPIEFDWKDERYVHHIIIVIALTVTTVTSVRAKIRACEPGYDIMTSFFIRALYKGFKGSTNDYERGFLRSSLLLKVRHSLVFSLPPHH